MQMHQGTAYYWQPAVCSTVSILAVYAGDQSAVLPGVAGHGKVGEPGAVAAAG